MYFYWLLFYRDWWIESVSKFIWLYFLVCEMLNVESWGTNRGTYWGNEYIFFSFTMDWIVYSFFSLCFTLSKNITQSKKYFYGNILQLIQFLPKLFCWWLVLLFWQDYWFLKTIPKRNNICNSKNEIWLLLKHAPIKTALLCWKMIHFLFKNIMQQ
jgi:hypothetical protein